MMFEENLTRALLGRRLSRPLRTSHHIYGSELGFGEGDVHHLRIYQLELTPDSNGALAELRISVVGDLISPCSGYTTERLDEFDWQPLLAWCEEHL